MYLLKKITQISIAIIIASIILNTLSIVISPIRIIIMLLLKGFISIFAIGISLIISIFLIILLAITLIGILFILNLIEIHKVTPNNSHSNNWKYTINFKNKK